MIDLLIEKIKQTKNPSVVGLDTCVYYLPQEMQDKINKLREHRELEIIQFEDYIGTKK